jgi:hypothetical protein
MSNIENFSFDNWFKDKVDLLPKSLGGRDFTIGKVFDKYQDVKAAAIF